MGHVFFHTDVPQRIAEGATIGRTGDTSSLKHNFFLNKRLSSFGVEDDGHFNADLNGRDVG